jgi:hypothetical protein
MGLSMIGYQTRARTWLTTYGLTHSLDIASLTAEFEAVAREARERAFKKICSELNERANHVCFTEPSSRCKAEANEGGWCVAAHTVFALRTAPSGSSEGGTT